MVPLPSCATTLLEKKEKEQISCFANFGYYFCHFVDFFGKRLFCHKLPVFKKKIGKK
jgi:hypothetical protein